MFNRIQKTSLGLFVAALSVAALAVQDGLTLKRVAKAGDTIKYRLKIDVAINGQEVNFNTLNTEKVVKVEENGNYVIDASQTGGKLVTPDQELPMDDSKQTFTFKANGEVVAISAPQVSPAMYRVANLQWLVSGDKPVKVGDTWATEIKKDEKTGAVAVKGSYKVLSEELVGTIETIKISMVNKEVEGGDASATHEGTVWLNKKDGSLVKGEGQYKNVPFPGLAAPVTAKYVTARED